MLFSSWLSEVGLIINEFWVIKKKTWLTEQSVKPFSSVGFSRKCLFFWKNATDAGHATGEECCRTKTFQLHKMCVAELRCFC